MVREEDVKKFEGLLAVASGLVGQDYFLLPVANGQAGVKLTKYRERVYAYELYHRLRCIWPKWTYSLNGEVDKGAHTLIRVADLKNVKPDLLVHVPGKMEENLIAIEIKAAPPSPLNKERSRIKKDLKKLAAFCEDVKYQRGILFVYGEGIERIRDHIKQIAQNGVRLDSLELWHQSEPGKQAQKVNWNASGT